MDKLEMSDFRKERHNPLELIKRFWPEASVKHITYDPSMRKGDYYIIRQSRHDGTLLFTLELLQRGLIKVINKESYCTKTISRDLKYKDIKYTVGPMKHSTVYGQVYLPCSKNHKYPGQAERIRMPVKCEYIY